MLALRAYGDSIGYLNKNDLPAFTKEQPVIETRLNNGGVANDYTTIENTLNDILGVAADRMGVKRSLLIKGVNLALYNEGMWRARDIPGYAYGVSTSNVYIPSTVKNEIELPQRTRLDFTACVNGYYNSLVDNEVQFNSYEIER